MLPSRNSTIFPTFSYLPTQKVAFRPSEKIHTLLIRTFTTITVPFSMLSQIFSAEETQRYVEHRLQVFDDDFAHRALDARHHRRLETEP